MAAFAAARRALAAALVPAGLADAASCFCEKDGTSCFLKHGGLHMQMTTETATIKLSFMMAQLCVDKSKAVLLNQSLN